MTVPFIRKSTQRNSSWPGDLIYLQSKAEYICADLSIRHSLFPCSRAADHTFREPLVRPLRDGVLSMRATIKFIMASPTLLLILCASCTKGRTPAPRLSLHQTMSGDGWLSWTPAERSRYVYGYIEGYSVGSFDTCESSTDLFATKLPYLAGDENSTNVPLSRCIERRQKYSKPHITVDAGVSVSPYPETITELYEKYPDSQSAPYVLLLGLLSDGQATSAEELYRAQLGKAAKRPRIIMGTRWLLKSRVIGNYELDGKSRFPMTPFWGMFTLRCLQYNLLGCRDLAPPFTNSSDNRHGGLLFRKVAAQVS